MPLRKLPCLNPYYYIYPVISRGYKVPEVRALATPSQLSHVEGSSRLLAQYREESLSVSHERRLVPTPHTTRRRAQVSVSRNDHGLALLSHRITRHITRLFDVTERNVRSVEQLPHPNVTLNTAHPRVPPSTPFPDINETQKNIIESTLNLMLFDYLEDIDPTTVVHVLNAVTESNLSDAISQSLISLNLYESVKQIRDILSHPCPQNRTENYPYFGAPEDSNRVVYKDKNGRAAFETRGLLSLTARNDDTATPITREATIRVVLELISEKITYFNTLIPTQTSSLGR